MVTVILANENDWIICDDVLTKKTMIMSMICLWTLIGQAVVMVSSDLVDPLETMKPEVQKEIVDAANKCRREVQPSASNMAMLEWSEEARATALKYAQVCSLDHSQLSERVLPSELQCGENMMFASNNISWTSIINAFCNEKKDFTYDVGPN
ncbi:cysteine-rich venom protein-like, partial [Gastrophryne carolinensis]